MTSQGAASGCFTPAITQRNLFTAEMAIRELGGLASLHDGLDYLDLLVEVDPEKLEQAFERGSADKRASSGLVMAYCEEVKPLPPDRREELDDDGDHVRAASTMSRR
jgi:hypothetical protein